MSFNIGDFGLTPSDVGGIISGQSGWAIFVDGVHTLASPQVIAEGATATLTNNAVTSITTQTPSDATAAMWDGLTSKFGPIHVDDYYLWFVRFKAKNTAPNGGYIDAGINIGGTFGRLFDESHLFVRGANVEQSFNCLMGGYSGATFMSNGGLPRATSGNGTTSIYAKEYHVVRLHKGR